MSTLPKITEKELKAMSSSGSYSKGLSYYKSGAVLNPERSSMTLRAEVTGSEYQPYRVTLIFDEGEIEEAGCTCPYDYGGFCKHQVAVLLRYIHEPESFVVHASLAEQLAKRSREELIILIERMIEREPDLRDLLSTPIAGKESRKNPVNVDGYRRELQRHINDYDEDQLIRSVRSIIRNARDFAKAKDYANAIRIYGCILEETIADENFEYWGEWELLEPLDAVLVALEECMKAVVDDAEMRRSILIYWLKARNWDLRAGGIGFAEETGDWLENYLKAEDVPFIRPLVEKGIRNNVWAQEAQEEFLAYMDLLEGKDPELSLQRILDKGLYSLYFDKMLELKRLDEALSVWNHFSPFERVSEIPYLANSGYAEQAIRFAEEEIHKQKNYRILDWLLNQYVETGADEKAVKLAESLLNQQETDWLYKWLVEHFEGRKNPEMILQWNQKRFKAYPTIEHYSALKAAANNLKQWQSIEPEILKDFKLQFALMTKIHMLEKRWLAAWDSLEHALQEKPKQRSIYGYMPDETYRLDLELAETAREHTPERSIAVYLKYARLYIQQRQRNSYAEAAQYLRKVQSLYLKTLQNPEGWQVLISSLREEFKTLRAMQDEFNKAGLYK